MHLDPLHEKTSAMNKKDVLKCYQGAIGNGSFLKMVEYTNKETGSDLNKISDQTDKLSTLLDDLELKKSDSKKKLLINRLSCFHEKVPTVKDIW
jgi:hypothetical protein